MTDEYIYLSVYALTGWLLYVLDLTLYGGAPIHGSCGPLYSIMLYFKLYRFTHHVHLYVTHLIFICFFFNWKNTVYVLGEVDVI